MGTVRHLVLVFIVFALSLTALYSQKSQDKDVFTVVLDAGHGGKDSGNRGNQYYEKHIALNVTLKIGAILSKKILISTSFIQEKVMFLFH